MCLIFFLCMRKITKILTCTAFTLLLFFFLHNSLTVDEVQAKVALVHDEERVLSEDEAVVSRLSFIRFTIVPAALTVTTKIETHELPPTHVTASFHLTDAHSAHFRKWRF